MSTGKTFWEKLTGREKARERSAEQRWAEAVAAIEAGKPPPESEIEALLTATSPARTVTDLQAAVARLSARRADRAALDRGRAAAAAKPGVEQQVVAVNTAYHAALAEAQRQAEEKLSPLRQRLAEIDRDSRDGVQAEARLRNGSSQPSQEQAAELAALKEQAEDATRRQGAAGLAAGRLRPEIATLAAKAHLESAGIKTPPAEKASLLEKVEHMEAEVSRFRQVEQGATAVREKIGRRISDLTDQIELTP
jgi:hypothetical protein